MMFLNINGTAPKSEVCQGDFMTRDKKLAPFLLSMANNISALLSLLSRFLSLVFLFVLKTRLKPTLVGMQSFAVGWIEQNNSKILMSYNDECYFKSMRAAGSQTGCGKLVSELFLFQTLSRSIIYCVLCVNYK